jgi:hypothetical protein
MIRLSRRDCPRHFGRPVRKLGSKMRKYCITQTAQVVVGCSCACRLRYFPGDPALVVLAQSKALRESWWVLVECQICGERRAFGEAAKSHIPLRWRGAKYPIRPAQFRLMIAVRERTIYDDAPLPAPLRALETVRMREANSSPKEPPPSSSSHVAKRVMTLKVERAPVRQPDREQCQTKKTPRESPFALLDQLRRERREQRAGKVRVPQVRSITESSSE